MCVLRCLSLPVMLRAVLNKAAVESARQPVSKKSPTPPATTVGLQRIPLASPLVTISSTAGGPVHTTTPPAKLAAPGERGQHNPMLTSLLESDTVAPDGSTEAFDGLRQKRTNASDMAAMKRQASVDEVFNAAGAALSRPSAAFQVNAIPPISRSYSVPAPTSCPRPLVKLEPLTSLAFANMKPLMASPADHGRTFSVPRSSTSELIHLLSSDDFAGPTSGTSDISAENQFELNGSSKSLSVATSGRILAGNMDWSNGSSVDASVDWETSSSASDDLRQKSLTSKNGQVMRNSLPSGGIKTESTTIHDGATTGLVAGQDKPPITVKFTRRILKPSTQRRSTPDSDSATNRAVTKERAKSSQAPKLNSTMTNVMSPESLDFEVDSLTSSATSVMSSSPGRSSASPRLPGGGTGPPEIIKPGEKRPRVVGNKLIGTPAEKKRRSDEGRKMSRKIYEFDDDSDVFVSGGGQSGKISTIKITKSEGRLQIQKSGTVVSPGASRPVHKSMSSTSGPVSTSAVRLGRPPGFPLRPVVRSKSLVTQKSESKALGLPVVRMKTNPAVVCCGGITPPSSSGTKPAVANASKSSANSTAAAAKSKSVQPAAKRKGSLSAVIEKLSKGVSAGAEPDKKLYDDIRLAIIREGNKPSTPTREMLSSSNLSLSKSSMSAVKRPEAVKESSVRLTVPVRKPPVSSGSQVVDLGRSQAAMVRFTAPPASPPSAANDQRPPHSLPSEIQLVPKIPREQNLVTGGQSPGGLQSLRPNVAVSRMSELEVSEAGGRGTLSQPMMRMMRPLVSCTVLPTRSSPVTGETVARTKTPDALVGRGVDPTLMPSVVGSSEDMSERFHPVRHFMDAMAHGSRVSDSNVVVERRLSPPRSPSPPPATIPSGSLDLTRPAAIEAIDSREPSEMVSSSTGHSSLLECSNLPVDLSADSVLGSRQSDTSAVHFRTPSDVSLRSNSTRSPSASGSPVTSLIIDCFPGSPVLLTSSNAVSSPVATSASDTVMSVPSDTDDPSRVDMCRRQSMSPAMSVGETAAADIDDELMNEALMMSADVSNDQVGKL